MLEDFSLVHKRNMVRYEVDWNKNFILTTGREPSHIVLSIDRLIEGGEKDFERIASEIWEYINPTS